MVFAATRIDSSSRLMSRSAESEAPIAFNCSSLTMRSPSLPMPGAATRGICEVSARLLMSALFNADRAHFLHVRHSHEAFFHAVLLEGAHAVLQALREHLRHARVFLDELLQLVGSDEQLMQAVAPLEAGAAALVAADGPIEGQ